MRHRLLPGRIGRLRLFREQRVSTTSVMIEEREAASPYPGDERMIGGETFIVRGEPERRDPDRRVWTLDAWPA